MTRLGIPDLFSMIGPPGELYRHHGYDAAGIHQAVLGLLQPRRGQGTEGSATQ
jgi:hypothetical protein